VFLFIAPPSTACVTWFNIQGQQLTLVSEAYWAVAGFFYLLVFRAARHHFLFMKQTRTQATSTFIVF
jgi:hypothetical protein